MNSCDEYFIEDFDMIAELAPADIAFYGGSFNPPHFGHQAVAESALLEYVDYVVFCPHYHNPAKSEASKLIFHHVLTMLSIVAGDSEFSNRLFVSKPSFLFGIQNEKFAEMVIQLERLKIYSYVLCGADAINANYRPIISHIPHIIAPRGDAPIYTDILQKPCKILRTSNERCSYLVWTNMLGICQHIAEGKSDLGNVATKYFRDCVERTDDSKQKILLQGFLLLLEEAIAGNEDSKEELGRWVTVQKGKSVRHNWQIPLLS